MKTYPTRRPNGSITIYYIHKQKKAYFFIGHVINGKFWDAKTQRVRATKNGPNAAEINRTITHYQNMIEGIAGDLIRAGFDPTPRAVRQKFEDIRDQKAAATRGLETGILAKRLDVMALAREWHKAGRGPKKQWRASTKRAIKESLDAFEAYVKTIKGDRPLLKSELNLQLFQDYEAHLFEKGLVKNHIGKRMKHIRQFIATLEDLTFNPAKIKIYQIEKTPVALTESELTALETVNLGSGLMDQCRDMFLLGCYTSLRISDLKKLGAQHFQGDHIRILQEKNERTLKFPITPQIKRILEKYNYKLPRVHENDVNEQIKSAAALAGLDQPVELTRELKDKTIRYTKKKHEIISTHMAVKTFITLALSWGVSIPDIAAVVGKHVRTIQGHYAAGDRQGATEKLRELWEQRTHLKVI